MMDGQICMCPMTMTNQITCTSTIVEEDLMKLLKTATKHISNFAMGNDIADLDNDGYFDILTLDMVSEDNYGQKTSMARHEST